MRIKKAHIGWLLAGWTLLVSPAFADAALTAKIDAYLQPTVDAGRFSGSVLVTQDGSVVFDKAYGFANVEQHIANQTSTSFHIGSLTRLYTAATVMMLVDKQRLWLTNTVVQFVPGIANGDKITIADLLNSKDPADYDLLARIVEIDTAKPLADIMDTDFFGPFFMHGSGLDDGTVSGERSMARGYVWDQALHPAAPSGGGYTTTRDELRWIEAFFEDRLVSPASRQTLLDGTGWKRADTELGGPAYFQEDEGHGFSSLVLHVPKRDVTVIVLGNIESAQGTMGQVGIFLATLALGSLGEDLPPQSAQ